ncbi:hypothetical protein [Burkholderia sp. JKS000303]|uniref:hypothetical protein n=1 Tax=Burkholderia sp. JKS000303 TaxID=1938747 RepID=UPI000C018421|nr:hypothetical protein [Burkholderia sp. JKS000303]PFH29081.1 hypothetical protein BX604_2853 [Burkholderia sp. JKS000303]
MIRARFSVNLDDPRPVNWPISHPYWVTGYGENHATIVAYADDETEIMRNWPDAHDFSFVEAAGDYVFTDRFPKPAWFAGDAPEAT